MTSQILLMAIIMYNTTLADVALFNECYDIPTVTAFLDQLLYFRRDGKKLTSTTECFTD